MKHIIEFCTLDGCTRTKVWPTAPTERLCVQFVDWDAFDKWDGRNPLPLRDRWYKRGVTMSHPSGNFVYTYQEVLS